VHPFWLSHEEKRPWLELSMGGSYGRSWRGRGVLGALGAAGGAQPARVLLCT
jgi:hypothetical protein